MLNKVVRLSLIIGLSALFYTQASFAQEKAPIINKEGSAMEAIYMKVNFYAIDREKIGRGEYLGFVEFKDNKLSVEVTDSKLEQILKSPYTTMSGEYKNGAMIDKIITYESATIEHLRAIAIECHSFGYISEMLQQK